MTDDLDDRWQHYTATMEIGRWRWVSVELFGVSGWTVVDTVTQVIMSGVLVPLQLFTDY